ncbi:sigma-70 family RNA polymerase sigma factor [Leadbettera azotonutricia]|uniref:RNA polymerase sigma factor RpoD n=1 Tax=Leadbettera azotonutricia (strain ATCC BAA-888 / DSM 13862 / ZAS-9) TaxID=545695 RepID=F5YBZ5_LEAAZ|nr:RNA polymerase sigma factor RpoD/SigA [Leadbettera azotonutricia]AEF83394.1 RNA polymerase sigma factor RpoD [Leadbettera azotonutricia ZAS-9]
MKDSLGTLSPVSQKGAFWEFKDAKALSAEDEAALFNELERYKKELKRLPHAGRKALDILENIRNRQNRLVLAFGKMVMAIAGKYRGQGLDFDDLVQEGCIGLNKAIGKFDHTLGTRFSTYAGYCVKSAINSALADRGRAVRLPAYKVKECNQVRKLSNQFYQENGMEPQVEELASMLGWESEKVRSVRKAGQEILSLNAPKDAGMDQTLEDTFIDDRGKDPADFVIEAQLKEKVRDSLQVLTKRQKAVVIYRFGLWNSEEHTLKEIGKRLNISSEAVHQLEARALNRLEGNLNDCA